MDSVLEIAKEIGNNLLPEKSKEKYIQVYNTFMKWKEEKGIEKDNFCEEIILVYFDHLKGM